MEKKQDIVKLKKASAYSFSVVLPKAIIERYGWKEHQKLAIKDCGRGVIEITDWRKK